VTPVLWLAALLIGGFLLARPAAAAPAASLLEDSVTTTGDGGAVLMLKLTGLDAPGMADAGLPGKPRDLAARAAPAVEIATVDEVAPAGSDSRVWRLGLRVAGTLPAAGQQRWLVVTLDKKDHWLAYRLSAPERPRFSWTIEAMPNVAIEPDQAIPVAIAASGVAATQVRATLSTLVEKSSRKALAPAGFKLCPQAEVSSCTGPLTVPVNEPTRAWLHGATGPGQFEGSVTLASAELPQGQKLTMNVWVSSLWHQGFGVLAILAGVLLNLVVSVGLRNRANRNQLLKPVALLHEGLDRVEAALGQIYLPPGIDKSRVSARLADQRRALNPTVLESNGLPSEIASPWPAGSTTLEMYRQHVQAVSDWLGAIEIVVVDGFAGVQQRWSRANAAGKTLELMQALDEIQSLMSGTEAPKADAMRTAVGAALAKFDRTLFVHEADREGVQQPAQAQSEVRTPEQLRVETGILSVAGWSILALVTTLVGAYVLVWSPGSAGFGTPLDYLLCFAWGIGLATAGQQLSQATTSTVASSFGIVRN
jgi:hypothetical protein